MLNQYIKKHFIVFIKIYSIIDNRHKKQISILFILMLIGMIFEMTGLGLLIPILSYMSNPQSFSTSYNILNLNKSFDLNNQKQMIFIGMTILVFFYVIKSIYLILLTYRQNIFISNISEYISEKLFTGYLNLNHFFHINSNSSILSRNVTQEVAQLTQLTQAFLAFFVETSAILGISIVLLYIEPFGALTVIVFMLISTFLFYRITKSKLASWGNSRLESLGLMYKNLAQGLSGVKEIKIFGKEKYFINEFKKPNSIFFNTQKKVNTLAQIPRYYLELIAILGLAILTFVMLLKDIQLNSIITTLGVFMASAFRMIPSANRIMASLQQIKYSQPSVDLIYNELKLFPDFKNHENSTTLIDFNDKILIKELNFLFTKDRKIINDISFEIKKGQTIGIIGESGSGKSTLADLILGLLSPESGEIKVDNKNININIRLWQDKIGYVSQSIYLIDDTLKKNIAFGVDESNINLDSLYNAINSSNLTNFIKKLPEGLDTVVGERGVKLSGGQRQRIGIARAIYNNPEILILDEATSSLDIQTELQVMESINKLKGKKTIIIIAHRLSTIENCDYIIQIENGRIYRTGTPRDLLNIGI